MILRRRVESDEARLPKQRGLSRFDSEGVRSDLSLTVVPAESPCTPTERRANRVILVILSKALSGRVAIGNERKDAGVKMTGSTSENDVVAAIQALDSAPRIVAAVNFPGALPGLTNAGLYSWWVDDYGAMELSEGLGVVVPAGRVYAGQAGATRWPSGKKSAATLGGRIASQHLGGSVYGSTFRLTLASCLLPVLRLTPLARKKLSPRDEGRLSVWIRSHMHVCVFAYPDRDALGALEGKVLQRLDPVLNLNGMDPTPLRGHLSKIREGFIAGGHEAPPVQHIPIVDLGPDRGKVTLHDEMVDILRPIATGWMSTEQLAAEVNRRERYRKKDRSPVTALQILGRANRYPDVFERSGSQVRLRSK